MGELVLRRQKMGREKLFFYTVVGVVLLALLSCGEKAPNSILQPDTVLINGKIITVDPNDTIAEAVALKDGKILAVGSDKTIRRLVGETTQIIDLQGLTATPGLSDSHAHFGWSGAGLIHNLDLDYPKVQSVADMVALVQSRIDTLEPGEWLLGKGWDEGKLKELRYVYASDIDAVTPNNPVWLEPTMGHYVTVNSYALKLANITKNTPDPPGGTIDRHPDGTPTGLLKESAQGLVGRLIPPFTPEQNEEGLLRMIEEFNKNGMTAVKDPGIGFELWDLYQKVLSQDQLNVRVFTLWRSGKTIEAGKALINHIGSFTRPQISTGDDQLISGGVKIFFGGSGGARTAWVYDEWNKNYTDVDQGNHGYPVLDPDLFKEMVKMFHGAGLHVSTHAIGDRAIDWTVDTYAATLDENPVSGLRHGLIHCNIPTDHAIEVMSRLQKEYDSGYPETQATLMWWIGDTYAGNFGPERCLRFLPFKTYLELGMKWGGGSDFNVTPFEAKYGLWSTITRKPMLGSYGEYPYGKEQSVDIRAALRSYSIWNAHVMFMEDKIGSIEPGKYADIAIWDKDLYTIPTEELKELECQMTLLEGEIVYRNPNTKVIVSEALLGEQAGLQNKVENRALPRQGGPSNEYQSRQ